MTSEEMARKMVNDAIDGFKSRCMAAAMDLPLTTEGDEPRRAFAMQFRIADDVGKTIAAAIKR